MPNIARCACGGSCPLCKVERDHGGGTLAITQPEDAYEKEAEVIATRVMNAESTRAGSLSLEKKDRNSEVGVQNNSIMPPIVHNVLRSPGQSLDSATRAFMESRFGQDLGNVRVHIDARANASADALNAAAYTERNNIVFGPGEYEPTSVAGRHLLAHELTHVVQQQTGLRLKDGVGQSGDAYERHADAVADLVVNGKHAELLLGQTPGSGGGQDTSETGAGLIRRADQPVQMQRADIKDKETPKPPTPPFGFFNSPEMQKKFEEFDVMNQVKSDLARKIAEPYNKAHPDKVNQQDMWMNIGNAERKFIPGVHTPDDERVVDAIYRSLNVKRIGKGSKLEDWTWKWKGEPLLKKKTNEEKDKEALAAGTKYFKDEMVDKAAIKLLKVTTELIGDRLLLATAAILIPAYEIYGVLALTYELIELITSLREPAEKKLNAWQTEDKRIVAMVVAFYDSKKKMEDFNESINRPFNAEVKPITQDNTALPRVVPH